MKEPEIKLFGRKILLPDNGAVEEPSDQTDGGSCGAVDGEERGKADDEKQLPDEEDEKDISSEVDENAKSGSWMEEEEERNGEQKQLKKPDIILPCPRCNSMDTKFCYYNNYNVNQPRHFCKGCQRYWTAGGTMRNVPVGAGRRKNKNSHPHHITHSFKTMDDNSVQKPDDDHMPNLNGAPYPVPSMAWWTPAIPLPPMAYPMPFYPNPYWNCGAPWGSPNALGKHSRNGELIRPNSECSIVVPKTMRIDDLEEDAKTSIWEALGINHDRVSRGLFKALQPKNDDKKQTLSASSVLQANPAALSRSINFQETA